MTIEAISTTRAALIDIIRRLTRGIEPAFLHDPARPVLISVDGPFACGKSLFLDAARAELMGPDKYKMAPKFSGMNIWQDIAYGEEIEIGFLNSHAGDTNSFLAQRKRGGITFISNADDGHVQEEFYRSGAGIRIWLSIPGSPTAETLLR